MANRLLSKEEILVELANLELKFPNNSSYGITETSIQRMIDNKSVTYCTADLLLSLKDFSERILKPLVCAPLRPPLPFKVVDIVDQRGKTHGDYAEMSATIQKIKDAVHSGVQWNNLTPGQREALELIATKMGRIVCGDPHHHDHWADGSGYFQKGLESCR